MDPRFQYLLAIAPTIMLLAIALVGIVFAIRRRHSQPVASRLVISGLIALSANVILTIAVRSYARDQSFERYADATIVAQHLTVLHAALYALNVVGIALVTAAVFADRGVIGVGRLTTGSGDRGAASSADKGVDR
jgi:4-amino-4-deoxy-L-arabinose transferase-like glycosyltransferase